jgi:hypothetical protein
VIYWAGATLRQLLSRASGRGVAGDATGVGRSVMLCKTLEEELEGTDIYIERSTVMTRAATRSAATPMAASGSPKET